jgi:peptide/nickel transport system permease protein
MAMDQTLRPSETAALEQMPTDPPGSGEDFEVSLVSLNQDFVKTARAKGVPERSVIFKHALRNALLPVVTNVGLEIPFLFTGAIVTESIFSWPGMGRQFIQATETVDYPVLMGILLVTAVIVVFANLVADIAYAVVDPRVQYD